MAAAIKYLVVYEVRAFAGDLGSGKPITNTFYYRCGNSSTPPAYGADVAGSSSLDTFITNFLGRYFANIINCLSVNYKMVEVQVREIKGWKYGSPLGIISGIVPGTPTTITSASAVPAFPGISVVVTGVGGATAANGNWLATPTGSNTFTIPANTTGQVWSGGGTWQLIVPTQQLLYGNFAVLPDSSIGSVAGQTIPLFADVSARRVSSFSGKSWQGRNSFAPIAESQNADGALETAALALWNSKLDTFMATGIGNGGSDVPGSGEMFLVNVSKKHAFLQPTPFTASSPYAVFVQTFSAQPDLGSMIRRKPRLSSIIS